MSPKAEKISTTIINAVIGAIATLFVLFGTGAWQSKENTADHNADMSSINTKLDRVLDAVCQRLPTDSTRVCRDVPDQRHHP